MIAFGCVVIDLNACEHIVIDLNACDVVWEWLDLNVCGCVVSDF